MKHPKCLTCSKDELEKRSSNSPPKLVTAWDDDWEDEPTLPPLTTPMPKRSKHRKEPPVKVAPQPCQYHNAIFAPGKLALAIIECLGPDVPSSAIYRMSLENDEQQKPLEPIFLVQNNTLLRQRAATIAFPQVKSFPVMISGGYHAQVRLFLPPGLREDEITRYPLILHV